MTRPPAAYVLGSLASGALWGALAYALGARAIGSSIVGGVMCSPIIGLVIGLVFRSVHRMRTGPAAFAALLSLYLGAALFGFAVGCTDLSRGVHGRFPIEVVFQAVVALVWGTTITGYVLVLWPLAFQNHRLLGRLDSEQA